MVDMDAFSHTELGPAPMRRCAALVRPPFYRSELSYISVGANADPAVSTDSVSGYFRQRLRGRSVVLKECLQRFQVRQRIQHIQKRIGTEPFRQIQFPQQLLSALGTVRPAG